MKKVRNRGNATMRKRYRAISPEQFQQRVIALAQKAAKESVLFDDIYDLEIIAPKCHLSKEEMDEFRLLISRIKKLGNLRFSGTRLNKGCSVHTVPNRIG